MSVIDHSIKRGDGVVKVYSFDIEGPQRLYYRSDPCRCGCGGRDPWHARFFRRVVTNFSMLQKEAFITTKDGRRVPVIAIGEARLPMCKKPVRVGLRISGGTGGIYVTVGWYVDYDSVDFDK